MSWELLQAGARELGADLTQDQLNCFKVLAVELQKWGRKINLTAIREEREIIVKHFLDSLSLLRALDNQEVLLDIGSGAGFPALPIKIVRPDLQVVSVDAVEKKIFFQRHAARMLGLAGFEALHVRAEALAATHQAAFDVVVSRAFSDIPSFVRVASPLVKRSGTMVAMKGGGGKAEAAAAKSYLLSLGLCVSSVEEFVLPGSAAQRSLVYINFTIP